MMKSALTLVACSASLSLCAAGFFGKKEPPKTETAPCRSVTWELTGEALYLQPNGSDLYYAAEALPFDSSLTVPAASTNWKIFEIDPNYHFGFDVGVAARFPTAMGVEAYWERLHSDDSASHTAPAANDMIGPMFDIGPNSSAYQSAHGHVSYHFDNAGFRFARTTNPTKQLQTHFYVGGSFARIKQTMESTFTSTSGLNRRSVKTPSTFTGAGPEFGVDFKYLLGSNFFFTGGSNLSLMMGRMVNHTTYNSWSPDLTALDIPQPNEQRTSVPDRTQIVPGFEEKLGFSYAAKWGCCTFSLELGYQLQIYLNAVQTVDMTAPQALPNDNLVLTDMGVFAVGFERTLDNFMLSGPYFSAAIAF